MSAPGSREEVVTVSLDKYDEMLRLAAVLDATADELRQRSKLGAEVIADPAFAESEELAPATYGEAEESIRAATTGSQGLLSRSVELDADALVVRATVLTYRWIDELQSVAFKTLGSIAGRAIGYLAPEVALGGAIVSAGLIETDALDRDGLADYLNELAGANPDLLEHVTSGGGGLLDSLPLRSLLTAGVLAADTGRLASRGGLRALGADEFPTSFAAALRDTAGELVSADARAEGRATSSREDAAPRGLTDLIRTLVDTTAPVAVRRVAPSRYIAYLPGPAGEGPGRLRLVGGDHSAYATAVVRTIEEAVAGDTDARVMLVGCALGGVTAAEVAAAASSDSFVVDQVVTAAAPTAQVPRIPESTRVLALEDRTDPVALLGSLINENVPNRLTVVFDADRDADEPALVVGARAADDARHPDLEAELDRLRSLGFLAS